MFAVHVEVVASVLSSALLGSVELLEQSIPHLNCKNPVPLLSIFVGTATF